MRVLGCGAHASDVLDRCTMTELEHSHTVEAISARLAADPKPNYLRDWIYGGIDGAVTTFAIVAGVVGANLSSNIIIVLGLANLLADGFSMAAGNYSGTKAEVDEVKRIWEIEKRHIAQAPEGEREEVRQILRAKGITGEALEEAVTAITSDEERWIKTMLVEEYGLSPNSRSPAKSALSTFAAFIVCGAVPLAPFLVPMADSFIWSTAATGLVFFTIGSVKSRWSLAPWWWSGLETSCIGMGAAAVAYIIGYLLKGLVS